MVVPSLSWQMFGFLGYKWHRKRAPFSHLVLMQSIVQPATKPCDIYNNIAVGQFILFIVHCVRPEPVLTNDRFCQMKW
jgi:hypothetical protein